MTVTTALGRLKAEVPTAPGKVQAVLRPERATLRLDAGGRGVVDDITFLGHGTLVTVGLDDGSTVRARTGPLSELGIGDRVTVAVSGGVVTFAGDTAR